MGRRGLDEDFVKDMKAMVDDLQAGVTEEVNDFIDDIHSIYIKTNYQPYRELAIKIKEYYNEDVRRAMLNAVYDWVPKGLYKMVEGFGEDALRYAKSVEKEILEKFLDWKVVTYKPLWIKANTPPDKDTMKNGIELEESYLKMRDDIMGIVESLQNAAQNKANKYDSYEYLPLLFQMVGMYIAGEDSDNRSAVHDFITSFISKDLEMDERLRNASEGARPKVNIPDMKPMKLFD